MRLLLLSCLLASMVFVAHGEVAVSGGQQVAASFVKVLTDANFEHDTQASTGATTGDWFVEFYAPWCGHCVKLQPDWDRLSTWARDEQVPISIAKLDGTESIRTAKRFDIRGFPTLKLFSGGRVYDYEGPRTLDALKRYISNREWTSTSGSVVPGEVTFAEYARDYARETVNGLKEMIYRKPGGVSILVVIGFLVGILASMLVFIVFIEKKPIIHAVSLAPRPAQAASSSAASSGTQTQPTNSTATATPAKNAQAKKGE